MSDDTPAALRAAVERCLSDTTLSPASAQRVRPTLQTFVRYLDAAGVEVLNGVSAEIVTGFVGSRLRSGQRPTLATQYNRRTALRMLFSSARRAGLIEGDPTLDVILPPVDSSPTRPLTDDEVERCRHVAL